MGVVRAFIQTYKKQLIYAVSFVVLSFGGWYLFLILTTGTINIQVSDQAATTHIYKQTGTSAAQLVAQKKGDGQIRLKPGSYIAQTDSTNGTSSQAITVIVRSSQDLVANLTKLNDTQVIASAETTSTSVSDQGLLYLDGSDNKLKRVTPQNSIKTISDAVTFKQFQWADSQYGVGLGTDNILYSYTSGDTIPKRINAQQPANVSRFSLAPNRTLYVSGGTNTYRYSAENSFVAIDAKTAEARLAASNNGALTSSSFTTQEDTQEVTYIQNSGKKITAVLPRYKDAVWSNDGKRLALTTQSQIRVYDQGLGLLYTVPVQESVLDSAWYNNKTLVFATTHKLWAYDATQNSARAITDVGDDMVRTIAPPTQDGTVYFTVATNEKSGNNQQIAKTNIKNLTVPQDVKKLQENLPASTPEFNIDYINLTQPTVYIYPSQFGSADSAGARTYIEKLGVQLSDITVI